MSRDYGSGNLKEVGPGRYELRVSAGKDPITGKRRQVRETFHGTVKEARRRLGVLADQHGGRSAGSAAVTLDTLIGAWLDASSHAKGTRQNYDRARERIPAALRSTVADKIEPHDLQRLYTAFAAEHGPHPTHYVHALISGAYTHGRRLRWVRDHPARDLILPSLPKRKKSTPTEQYVRAMYAAARDPQQKLWLRLVIVLGRRRSEVLALRWSDIDLERAVVTVQRAIESGDVVKETKSGDEPEIAIDPATVKMIRGWQVAQRERALAIGVPLAPDPWLLSDDVASARPWRRDLATRRYSAIRKRAGVPERIRLNDLRHANVTTLIAAGTDVRTVAGRVGHDPSMSLGTYAGIVDAANRAAAVTIAAVLDDTG